MTPNRPLRGIFESSARFSRIPLPAILGSGLAAAGLVSIAWSSIEVGLAFSFFVLVDGVMLAILPRFGRSFGPPQLPWVSLILIRLTLGLAWVFLPQTWGLLIAGLIQLGLSVGAVYACWIEPMRLGVSEVTVRSPILNGCAPLRVLQISDLHIERMTERERRLLRMVHNLAPDVIVVTGDILNTSYIYDCTAQRQARELLSALRAPHGVFVIKGSPTVDPPKVFASLLEGLGVIWLRNEMTLLTWQGCELRIAGVECTDDSEDDSRQLRNMLNCRPGEYFTLLLHHTPDIMPEAVRAGVDLYIAGHTHGGQLRLPFYGALVTASVFGKRYEMGRYDQGNTTLYVSRGIGLEGLGAPRARFLCPPEITVFSLVGCDG